MAPNIRLCTIFYLEDRFVSLILVFSYYEQFLEPSEDLRGVVRNICDPFHRLMVYK